MVLRRKSRKSVIDAISDAYSNEYANVHRGLHFLSNAATDAYEAAREKVRAFLNAGSVDEIVFTKSSTEAINTVAYGYGMPKYRRGRRDRHFDHGASLQYRALAFHPRTKGAKLVWVPVEDEGAFHIEDFEKCLTEQDQAGCHHPYVECARHSGSGQGNLPDRP